jgi:carbon storage regulator
LIVVEVRGDRVRLGVSAPHEVPIHRREVYDAVSREAKCLEMCTAPASVCASTR